MREKHKGIGFVVFRSAADSTQPAAADEQAKWCTQALLSAVDPDLVPTSVPRICPTEEEAIEAYWEWTEGPGGPRSPDVLPLRIFLVQDNQILWCVAEKLVERKAMSTK